MTHKQFAAVGLAAVSVMFVGACSRSAEQPTSPTNASVASASAIPTNPSPNLRQADIEFFEVCKDYVGGTGPAVTITVAVDVGNNGSVDQTFPVSLSGGQCQDVWVVGGAGDLVTVTEAVPNGYTASYVRSVNVSGTITTDPSVAGGGPASGLVSGNAGVLVIFTNTAVPPPPPGNEGCTPGYWKQSHHFDSWPAPYTPTTQFSAVFENAFPGMTLVQVLSRGGGGLNALGRHTVAALLNAGSSGVAFGMTTAQVISAFNAVFPGGDYEGLKNQFAGLNERGCPLN